jgi:hypothetical protein
MFTTVYRITVIGCAVVLISGCAAFRSSRELSKPTLEGGQMYVVGAPKPDGSDGVAPLLSELSKIDLIYELDPKKYGPCNGGKDAPPVSTAPLMSPAAKLRCAMDGFYSPRYFDELTPEQQVPFEVSNVAFAYAEKQSARISELAKSYGAVTATADSAKGTTKDAREIDEEGYFKTVRQKIQTSVIDQQVTDLASRVVKAQEAAGFLEFQRRRRNQVQSSFMSASDAACDYYKRNLNRDFSRSNFFFGSIATIAGGLGAVLTDEGTSRALAGASGVTSGLRAEYNDAFFRNKVVELLTKAIGIAQERKREEIRRRGVQITADYSMEDALNDGVLYNAQCSLIAGLQETSESLQVVSDPGLKWLANAFGGAASNGELTSKLFESLGDAVSTVQQVQKSVEDQNAVLKTPEKQTPVPVKQ